MIPRPQITDDAGGIIPTPVPIDADDPRRSPDEAHPSTDEVHARMTAHDLAPTDDHRLWRCPECHTPRTTFGDRTSSPPRCLKRAEHDTGEPVAMIDVGQLGEREAPTDHDDDGSHGA
jgi:hypothetical protein